MDYQDYEELDSAIILHNNTASDQTVSQYEELELAENTDMLSLVQQNTASMMAAMELANNITDVYAESQRLNAQVEIVKERSKVELAKITAKFYATKDIIEKAFSERKEALSHYYKVLDNAIESGNNDLIVLSMQQIGAVVVSSPLADINKFIERFNDTSQPLLDF